MEQSDKKDEIQNYLDSIVNKSEFERMSITKEKTGVDTTLKVRIQSQMRKYLYG